MDWTWQGILTGLLATGLWAVGATVLTWVKNKWPKYGDLALYWIASFACLGIVWYAATGYIPFSQPQVRVTSENVESNVKAWSESAGLGFVKAPISDSYFGYTLTTRTGTPIQVSRLRSEKQSYLQFASTISFAPEHQAILGTLTKEEVDAVVQEITLELTRTRVGFAIANLGIPQTGVSTTTQTAVILQKAVLITNLSEPTFTSCIDDMEFSVTTLRAATILALRRAKAQQAKHISIHTN